MSNNQFIESTSTDPVERAIARKVIRILGDRTLDQQQRESLVKKAQRELLQHRRQAQQKQALRMKAKNLRMPSGYWPQAIQVKEGRMYVGVQSHGHSFVWLDAGEAPREAATNQPSFAMAGSPSTSARSVRKDPIAERRSELWR